MANKTLRSQPATSPITPAHVSVPAVGATLAAFAAMSFLLCMLLGFVAPEWGLHGPWLQFYLLPAMFAIALATVPAADPSVHDCWSTRDQAARGVDACSAQLGTAGFKVVAMGLRSVQPRQLRDAIPAIRSPSGFRAIRNSRPTSSASR